MAEYSFGDIDPEDSVIVDLPGITDKDGNSVTADDVIAMGERNLLRVGHTDEARALVAAGEARPGDKALDVPVSSMTDRELAEETVILLRNQRDAVSGLIDGFTASPLGAMMSGGKMGGPLGMLFGSQSPGA